MPTLRRQQSSTFKKLAEELTIRATPEAACKAAKEYGNYLRDVGSLKIQATCLINTNIPKPGKCASALSAWPALHHLFALAPESGNVYWATVEAVHASKDTQTP